MVKKYWECSICKEDFEERDLNRIVFKGGFGNTSMNYEATCKRCSHRKGVEK